MTLPSLCPLHGEHPELSCPSCDEAAGARARERLGKHVPSEGESGFGNVLFLLRRFARQQPDLTGSLLGIFWCAAAVGILAGLRWVLPKGLDPATDFVFQCAVFVAPFIVLWVFLRARGDR